MSAPFAITVQERLEQARTELATAEAVGLTAVRDSRIPVFRSTLLGGTSVNFAKDVAGVLLAIKSLTVGRDICTAVLTAMAIGFDPDTIRLSAAPLAIPATEGIPAIRAVSASTPNAVLTFPSGATVDVVAQISKTTSLAAPTDGDAAGILAMAVFAAGKQPTDDNKDGFIGGAVRGRVGALKEAVGATDLYLTGARSLTMAELKKIHSSFGADPAARHALFSPVALTLARPLTVCETAVQGQARLLRGEGHGSFERALHAVAMYGAALDKYAFFRSDMVQLRVTIAMMKAESYTMRTYGYILDRDAYDTLRVSKFQHLAYLGLLKLQKENPLGSIMRVKVPIRDATIVAAVKLAFDELEAGA